MDDMSENFFSTFLAQNEDDMEQDLDYMKSLYPKQVREINQYVEDQCDKLEFEGSSMLAEFPDAETIHGYTMNIYEKIQNSDSSEKSLDIPESVSGWEQKTINNDLDLLESSSCHGAGNCPPPPNRKDCPMDQPLCQLIQVMLCDEMCMRRRRYHRRRAMFR